MYATFHRTLPKDVIEHLSVEDQLEPARLALENMFATKNNIMMYVRRIFMMDTCDELILDWFNSVVGVVDSEDLPLNISPAALHQRKWWRAFQKDLVKKCLAMLLATGCCSEQFGDYLHFGVHALSKSGMNVRRMTRGQKDTYSVYLKIAIHVRPMRGERLVLLGGDLHE